MKRKFTSNGVSQPAKRTKFSSFSSMSPSMNRGLQQGNEQIGTMNESTGVASRSSVSSYSVTIHSIMPPPSTIPSQTPRQYTQVSFTAAPSDREPSPEPPSFDDEDELLAYYDDEVHMNNENYLDTHEDPEFQSYDNFHPAEDFPEDPLHSPHGAASNAPRIDLMAPKAPLYHPDHVDDLDVMIEQVQQLKNIPKLYQWQQELLHHPTLRQGGNIVYSVPTSGGKTLPAEILMLHTVRNRKKSALLIVPYISLVNEKYEDFQDHSIDFPGLDADAYFANRGILPPLEGERIMVATIEKSVSLINSLIETNRLHELGIVVIDEFHLVGDPRGIHIESIISKLIFLKKKGIQSPQIVGMSATIPNLRSLSDWILGDLYESQFRPVPLMEFVILKGKDVHMITNGEIVDKVRSLNSSHSEKIVYELLQETLSGNTSALVFCAEKRDCQLLVTKFVNHMKGTALLEQTRVMDSVHDQMITSLGSGINHDAVKLGICHHHAGLASEDRETVETLFKEKIIRILFCTSTLAAGVNLPAARVILNGVKVGRNHLRKAQYLQMCGRAGRAGYDTFGESFLVPRNNEEVQARQLIKEPLHPLHSQLDADSIRKLVMECAIAFLEQPNDIDILADSTLLSTLKQQIEGSDCHTYFHSVIQDLKNNQFLREKTAEEIATGEIQQSQLSNMQHSMSTIVGGDTQQSTNTQHDNSQQNTQNNSLPPINTLYVLSTRGKAIAESSCGVHEAIEILEELQRLQEEALVLGDARHMLFFLTPNTNPPILHLTAEMWGAFHELIQQSRGKTLERVMTHLGIDETFVLNCHIDSIFSGKAKNKAQTRHHSRFFASCIMMDMIQEHRKIKMKYNLRDDYQMKLANLRERAAYHCSATLKLCEAMGWTILAAIIKVYIPRIAEGCKEDLLPLLEIEGIGQSRARLLHRIGIKTPEDLAQAKKSFLLSKLGSKLAPKHTKADLFCEKLIQNAKRFLQRKAREHRRAMERMEQQAETQSLFDTQG